MNRFVALLTVLLAPCTALAQPPSFLNFESGQVRPLAMSEDGTALYVVNTPDDRLEVFDLTGAEPTLRQSVAVGLEPVAVAVESPGRVWVVNHLSDSVSIVDVASSPPRVVRTLLVGDEPRDVVFAGPGRRRAFVTTAHRGQNTPDPRGAYDTPGIGRADLWVFDADDLGARLGGTPLTVLSMFGDVPRALAVDPTGTRVYAAVFLSGNRTTIVPEGAVCDGGPSVTSCSFGGVSYPGGLPAPVTNHEGVLGPEVGLIVRQAGAGLPWLDELGRDWSAAVRFELTDEDVFAIDAMADPPEVVDSYEGVGTVLFGMAVHPSSGDVYVANTEAMNEVRFEGSGAYVRETMARPGDQPASVRGHLHEARVTRIAGGAVTPLSLNPHLDYDTTPTADDRWATIATPSAVAFSGDGSTLYVAALGSSSIATLPTSELEAGAVGTDPDRSIFLRDPWPGGPTGLVVDDARGRIYALTRFDNSVTTVDLETREVVARARMHSPEPADVVVGRPVLYDALLSSSNGESSCASCHVFGDNDGLAWDLGDPDGDVLPNPNPRGEIGGSEPFHPLKGPMTTQSLRGLADHGPMHWRGDRTAGHVGGDPLDEVGAFEAFNVAFDGLLGRDEGLLDAADMARFAQFATQIVYPPNPIRRLDNSLRDDEARGRQIYFERGGIDAISTCNGCHVLDRAQGFFGGDGRTTFESETQELKVPHLRNAYTKVGMFGIPAVRFLDSLTSFEDTGPQVRAYGLLHDGSIDTAQRFMHASVFSFRDEGERADVAAFTMAFDSTLPPIVGQQVTLDATADAQTLARRDLLVARAQTPLTWPGGATTRECDLVVRGVVDGEARGFWLEADGRFHSDRAADASLAPAELWALATGDDVLTATCAPPGSGARRAYDRDEDGARDADELDAGDDPADRVETPIPNPEIGTPPMPMEDGGPPDLDAGVTPGDDAGSMTPPGTDAGPPPPGDDPADCGCRAVGRRDGAAPMLPLLLLGLLWRRGRIRGSGTRR